jgi:hypothetical protein
VNSSKYSANKTLILVTLGLGGFCYSVIGNEVKNPVKMSELGFIGLKD